MRQRKLKNRLLSYVLSFAMVVSLLPANVFASTEGQTAAADAKVYMTVSNQGILASDKDGDAMANREVTVKDINSDGVLTFDEALVAAHAAYNSADGYVATEGQWGLSVSKMWGVATGNLLFYKNNAALTSNVGDTDSSTVKAGDYLVASINQDDTYYSDKYTYFDVRETSVKTEEEVTLTLNGTLSDGTKGLEGVSVGTWSDKAFSAIDGKTTDEEGKVTLSFAKAGTYYVTAQGTVSDKVSDYSQAPDANWNYPQITYDCPIVAPVCVVTVTSSALDTSDLTFDVEDPDGYVTISFADNGVRPEDASIDDVELYGEAVGTIIEETEVPFEVGDSIADVTVRLLDAMKLKYGYTGSVENGFYLAALKEFELNGTYYPTFGEFDAGAESGWCVRLNDWHINQGSSAIDVEDGDIVNWLYTCQFGADIGADFSTKSAEIKDIQFASEYGTLEPAFDTAVESYTYEVADDISEIAFKVELENYGALVTLKVDGTEVKYRPNESIAVTANSKIELSTELEYMDAANNNEVTTYTDSVTIQLKTKNHAPIVVEGVPATMEATVGKEISVDLAGFFTDVDNDTLTYSIKITALGLDENLEGSTYKGTIPVAGTYDVVLTASDGKESVSHTVTLSVVVGNQAPTVVEGALTTMSIVVGEEISVDLSKFFADADNDTLTYNIKIAALGLDKDLEGTTYTGAIPAAGTYDVVLTASDGKASISHTVTLTVTEKENTAPNIKAEYAETKGKTYVYSSSYVYIYMDDIFEDADGDTLTYKATLDGEEVEVAYNSWTKEYYIQFATKPVIREYKIVANDGKADSEVFTATCIGTTATITPKEGEPLIPGGTYLYYIYDSAEDNTFALDYTLDVDTDIVPEWMSSNTSVLTANGDGTFTVNSVTSRQQPYVGVTYGKDSWGSTLYLGTKSMYILPAMPTIADMTVELAEHADNVVASVVANAVSGGWYSTEFTYSVENPSICDITTSGSYGLSVTPKALGTTTVTATFIYDESISCTFDVTVTGRSLQMKDQAGEDSVVFEKDKKVQMEVLGAEDGETFTWTSSDEDVATVDENGLVTVKALGTTYITATSSLSTEEKEVKASLYLQVKEGEKVYLEDLAISDYTYFDGFISAKSGFNSATLTYDWKLNESRYTYNKLAFTPYFDDENLNAVLYYQVSGVDQDPMELANGTAVSITNGLNPGENIVTIDVYPVDDEENVTTYTFNIFRPYNPSNTITRMTIYPNGETALAYPTYLEYKEGTIFQWDEENNDFVAGWGGRPSTGWSSSRYSYKTFAFGARTSTISVYPTFAYAGQRVMIYVDGKEFEEAVTNWKSAVITLKEEGITEIKFHVNSEKYHAEQLAAGVEDPFAVPENVYTLYVEKVTPLGIDAKILSAELDGGEFYKPGFSSESYTISGLIPSGETNADLTFTVPAGIDVYKTSVSDANKLTAVGQDEDGNNVYTTGIVSITGTGMYAYSTTNIILQVTDVETGEVGKTQYAFSISQRGEKDIYPDSIEEYLCIGSQYTNVGSYGTMPERTLKNGGSVLSLGNFGGYIVYKYDTPIENNPNNPYGVDFVIYGNSFGNGAHEPGYVQVSKDGKTWYTLAGSEHYDDHNDWDYSMTYTNNSGKSAWENSDGESGEIYNYPSASLYPYFNWTEELEESMTVTGPRLNSSAKDAYGSAAAVLPVFGYVDVNTNGTINGTSNNPYNHPGTLAAGGDMFDLAWAVDEDGMPVELDSISYIRVATASSIYAGAIGEKSTEVTTVNRVTNTAEEAVGETTDPISIVINGEEITVPANGATQLVKFVAAASVDETDEEELPAVLTVEVEAGEEANVYINNLGATTRSYVTAPEKGIIRIIVQEGEKEPYICYLVLDEEAAAVENLIEAITDVTLESEEVIVAAREAYEALTDEQKALVENLEKLEEAEEMLAELKAEAEANQKAAEAVEKLIEEIGEVTLKSEKAIEEAREAYETLTETQKALVENEEVLKAAEKALADLKAEREEELADIENLYESTGKYLVTNVTNPIVNSIGGEWAVLGLARAGYEVPEGYYDTYVKNVIETLQENDGVLHNRKYTEYSRVILALSSIGYDVTDVAGYNLLTYLADYDKVVWQGINGPIWALIALDACDYEIPVVEDGKTQTTREKLIACILEKQLEYGGWALRGTVSDTDMTAMAIQALAPYYETDENVKAAVDEALVTLSKLQGANGIYTDNLGNANAESNAQVVVALTSLGIHPDTDERFVKGGVSVLDALCSFYVSGGGFSHLEANDLDGMATEQGYYALVSYVRMLNGQTTLYDMSDVAETDKIYTIISGADSTWKAGDEEIVIVSDGEFAEFQGIKVDGTLIDNDNYTAVEGSTSVTFKVAYLSALNVGKYMVTFVFDSQEVSTSLTIEAEESETEEPGTDEPGTEEPGTEEPGTEEPGTEEPGTEEPGTEEPGTDEPGTEEPGTDEPGTEEPGTDKPGTEEPGTDEPGTDEPGTEEPGTEEPGTEEPGTDKPGTEEPGTDEPGSDEPGSDVPETDIPGSDESGSNTPGLDESENDNTENDSIEEPDSDEESETPATGDTSPILPLVAMMALAAIVACVAWKKRHENA